MIEVGTDLLTVAEPVGYDRKGVPHPRGETIDIAHLDELWERLKREGKVEPLAAGIGRYVMTGTCGALKKFLDWEYCSNYENRPQVCRKLDMAGPLCLLMRFEHGVPIPLEELSVVKQLKQELQ